MHALLRGRRPAVSSCFILAAFLTAASSALATVTGHIVASRTTGVAPLAVNFDTTSQPDGTQGTTSSATTRPFHDVYYLWDYGDINSGTWATNGKSKNHDTGPIGGHVFETPGTYTVTLLAKDTTGATDTKTVTITVQDPDVVFSGTNTICISRTADFTGAPSGSTHTTTTSWTTIKGLLGTGKRVLLHRGQAWDHDNAQRQLTFAGPGILGAFGSGAAPIIDIKTAESTGGGRMFLLGDSSHPNQFGDFRFMDLEIRGNNIDRGFANVNATVHDLLFLRINMHDAGRFFEFGGSTLTYYNDPHHGSDYHPGQTMYTGIHVVDTQYNHIIGDGAEFNGHFIAFIASVHSIFMGNTWNDSQMGEHVLRIPYGQRLIIAHNRLSNCRAAKHVIKLHAAHDDPTYTGVDPTDPWGFNSKYIVIADNYIANSLSDWYIAVGPQNSTEDELVTDVILERNEVVQLAGTTGWEAFDIRADEITIRNNAFVMTGSSGGTAIYLGWRGGEPLHHDVRVYNNSAFQGGSGAFTFVNVQSSVSSVTVKNNLAKSTGSSPVMIGGPGSPTQSNNSLTSTPGWVSSAPTTAFGFDLLSSSTAINGGTSVPVFDDYDEAPRPQSTTWDIGAFEFISSTPVVSIAATIAGAAEPSTNGMFTVTAAPAPTSPITVNLSIGGTATNGTDYTTISNTVTVGTSGSATINVAVTDDATVESPETVTLTVTSGTGYTVGSPSSATVTINDNDTANSVPVITTGSPLPGGTAGVAYSTTLAATGGDGALVWSLASGSLPAGLSLSSGGVISGTPTFGVDATFTIKVADSDGNTGPSDENVKTFTLSIAPASGATKFTIAGGSVTASGNDGNLPANTVDANLATRWSCQGDGSWIQYDLGASSTISYVKIAWYVGDTRVASFDVQTSDSSTGPWTTVLANQSSSGATTALELSDFADVTARYLRIVGHGNTDNSWNSITEVEVWGSFVNSVPSITTSSLPNGTAGASYSQTLAATGGNGALTWTLDAGALPAGLSLSSGGVISGTPSFGGTSVFTVRVADSDAITGPSDEATRQFTLVINPVSGPTKFTIPGASVTASADDGNVPANTVDGNLGTRWSAQGNPQWIQYDLGSTRTVSYVKIAWYSGDTRTSTFDVQVATSSSGPWTNVLTNKVSSGTTTALEVFDFADASARYVRINGHGNSTNDWNSISETEVWGIGLPSPWVEADIGPVGAAGTSSYSSGTFSIDGSGVGIGNNADEFHYVYQTASGDCSVIAKVLSVENTNASAKAGVMIRETLGDTSKHASVIINPSNNAVFVRRTSTGGTTSTTTQGAAIPYWVKITRVGDTFTASRSSDGSSWTTIQSQTITMTSSVYIGLAVTSTNDGTLCTATMSNVTASP